MSIGINRFKVRRDLFVSLLLFLLLIVFALLRTQPEPDQPYDLDSPSPVGLLALRLWFEEMGYQVERTDQQQFELSQESDLLFIYPNIEPYTEEEAAHLATWVESGKTAILIGVTLMDQELVDQFGVQNIAAAGFSTDIYQRQPLLPELEVRQEQFAFGDQLDLNDAPNAVTLLTDEEDQVVAAIQQVGNGLVWHLTTRHDFVNRSLRDEQQALLVPALLRAVPEGGQILFDSYHLFGPERSSEEEAAEINSLQDWLYRTPMGWAILFGIMSIFGYLLLQGWRLGPPLPADNQMRRREAAEYVEAMAGLQRRARQRDSVATYHKQRLKIGVGKPLHIQANLPDEQFISQLEQADHRFSPEQLKQIGIILRSLSDMPNETQLVRLVSEVDQLVGKK